MAVLNISLASGNYLRRPPLHTLPQRHHISQLDIQQAGDQIDDGFLVMINPGICVTDFPK